MNTTPSSPVIRQEADIPQARLDKGIIKAAQIRGLIHVAEFTITVNSLTEKSGHWHTNLIAMNDSTGEGGGYTLKVGETANSPIDGISITLLALSSMDGAQSVRILIEPYQDGPAIQQKADTSQPLPTPGTQTYSLRAGGTTTLKDGTTISLGYHPIANADGTHSMPVLLGNKYSGHENLTLKPGKTQTPRTLEFFDYSVTLLALTDIDGNQGATLLITPVSQNHAKAL